MVKENKFELDDEEFEDKELDSLIDEEGNVTNEQELERIFEEEIEENEENFDEKQVVKVIQEFENQVKVEEDDEYVIDPRTGSRSFKLDKNGCRKGWEWDSNLGRCIPIKKFKKPKT